MKSIPSTSGCCYEGTTLHRLLEKTRGLLEALARAGPGRVAARRRHGKQKTHKVCREASWHPLLL